MNIDTSLQKVNKCNISPHTDKINMCSNSFLSYNTRNHLVHILFYFDPSAFLVQRPLTCNAPRVEYPT